jgi:hypothetical protein
VKVAIFLFLLIYFQNTSFGKAHNSASSFAALPTQLQELQFSLFKENFFAFISDLQVVIPNLDISEFSLPKFRPELSRQQTAYYFLNSIIKEKKFNELDKKLFFEKAKSLLIQKFKKRDSIKLSTVDPIEINLEKDTQIKSIEISLINKVLTAEDYQFPVEEYINQRLPISVRDFISINKPQIFLHSGSQGEMAAFHHKEGFTEAYVVSSRLPGKRFIIVYNRGKNKFRFLMSGFLISDTFLQIESRLAFIPGVSEIIRVKHKNPLDLFNLNRLGSDLVLSPNDKVIIGLRSSLLSILGEDRNWQRQSLSDGWLGIDLYSNIKTGLKIINARNVYAEEVLSLLDTFYNKGARQFIYMGTAGALDERFQLGDILAPTLILGDNEHWIKMKNDISYLVKEKLPINIWTNVKHGHVHSVLDETNAKLNQFEEQGVQSLDMEAKYFANFAQSKTDLKIQFFLVVSDKPNGKVHFSNFFSYRSQISDILKIMTPSLINSNNQVDKNVNCKALLN